MSFRTSNPALGEDTFDKYTRNGSFGQAPAGGVTQANLMTVEGTVNKTAILLLLAVIAASVTWSQSLTPGGFGLTLPIALGGAIGAFIVSLVTIFKPSSSRITAPIYAILEGLFLGAVSALFNEKYHGIVFQAVSLTFGTLAVMLFAYRTGLVRMTDKLRMGIVAATGAVCLFALVRLGLGMFGNFALTNMMWNGSPLAIGISLVIVVIAALNLLLDFDLIDEGAKRGAPKFMEWYCGFSIMVTIVWLYWTFLRLLSNLNRR